MVLLVIILLNTKKDSKKDESRHLSNIREHLRKLIDDKKKNGDWKIQLIMKINSRSDNFEIVIGADTIEIIRNLFNSILRRYQKRLAVSMRGSEFVFDHVESMNYIFHKLDLKRLRSYIETPHWIKKKKQQ